MAGFITGLKSVEEVEAGIYEVVVILQEEPPRNCG